MFIRLLLFSLPYILLVTACSSPGTAPTEEPENAAAPTETPKPTPTAEPTATAEPTPTTALTDIPPPPTPMPTPSNTPEPESLFTFITNPVVRRGLSGGWDEKYINPGAMLFHDGKFHMFRNGFRTWPGKISVGYATSDDGRSWSASPTAPVFTSNQVPYATSGADVSAVYVADDGTWVMYFHTLNSPSVIGRATAPEPTGPWTADPDPVLTPGGEGTWDSRGLVWPSVVKTDEGLVMFYGGTFGFTTQIGRATSPDGITWTKYDDPATTEAPFQESDPVIIPKGGWDGGDVNRPEVVLTSEGWVMFHMGNQLITRGLSFSDDGIHWTQHPDNPIITAEQFPTPNTTTWDTALLHHNDNYFYFMEIGTGAATDIFLALHEGRLRP